MSFRIRIERTETQASATRRRSLTVAAATAVAVILVGGVSYAFWTATGTGSSTATAVTAQTLTVSTASLADLYPNKPVEGLTFTVSNPNPYVVSLNSGLTIGTVTSTPGLGPCAASNLLLSVGPVTISGTAPFLVPAKSGNTNGSATFTTNNFIQLDQNASNNCQGATFTVPVSVTGNQQ
jgi:hypothetical protein